MTLMLEYWKPIACFEEVYEISNMGRVFRPLPGRALTSYIDKTGYLRVTLRKNCKPQSLHVHSLVAATFLGPRPTDLVVNHLDSWRINPRLSNLEYTTDLGNVHHAMLQGRLPHKLSFEDIPRIRELAKTRSVISIAAEYNVNRSNIYQILRGDIWGHVASAVHGAQRHGS